MVLFSLNERSIVMMGRFSFVLNLNQVELFLTFARNFSFKRFFIYRHTNTQFGYKNLATVKFWTIWGISVVVVYSENKKAPKYSPKTRIN